MNVRFFVSFFIVIATGILQAEIGSFFNINMTKYYDQSLLNILSFSNYIMSILIPFGFWILFCLLVHMSAIIFNLKGNLKGIIEMSGLSFLPFMLNFVILYLMLIYTNTNLENQMDIYIKNDKYDIELFNEVYLSDFKILGNIASVIFLSIYVYLVKINYNTSFIRSIGCVLLPISFYIFINYLIL